MKIQRTLKLMALMLMIAMASVLLVPISFFTKDNQPKYLIEYIEMKDDDAEKEDIKALF